MSSEPGRSCPDRSQLEALAKGIATDELSLQLEAHLTECDECCQRLEEIGADFFKELDTTGTSPGQDLQNSAVLGQAIENLKSGASEVLSKRESKEPIPDFLGNYEILDEVARGGMGVVLRAHDPDLQRVVAIKVLAPELASNAILKEGFLREARAAAKLNHDNVMPIYAVEADAVLPYLVMPYVESGSLENRLRLGELTSDEQIVIGFQICKALEAAHAEDLVHFDVKPANILLAERDGDLRVWLADFGLARAIGSSASSATGMIGGTPGFVAPEQLKGGVADHRADLFALGCVLFAMMNGGRSPFDSQTAEESLRLLFEEVPKFNADVSSDSRWFAELIGKLLQKEPGNRPQTAEEVGKVFEKHLPGRGAGKLSRRTLLLGGVAIVGAGISLYWIGGRRPPALPEGFVLNGEGELFETLEDAVASASPGDTVVVRRDGTVELDSLIIGPDLPLRIQAAANCHPVFTSKSLKTSMISSESPLCLEGLEFRHPFAENPGAVAPMIHVKGGALFMANCRVIRSTSNQRSPETTDLRHEGEPLVRADNCEEIEIFNCELCTIAGTNVAIEVEDSEKGQEQQSLRFSNNLFAGQMGIRMSAHAAWKHEWELLQNTFVLAAPLSITFQGEEFSNHEISYEQNIFDFAMCFLELRDRGVNSPSKLALENVKLDGSGNFYRRTSRKGRGKPSFVVMSKLTGKEAKFRKFESFEQFAEVFDEGGQELEQPVFDWGRIEEYRADFSLINAGYFKPSVDTSGAGFDVALLGPGEGYVAWRETEEYVEWTAQVEKVLKR